MNKLKDIQIHLIDINQNMTNIWENFFKNIPNVYIHNTDLHTFLNQNQNIEAIVSPANSFGLMDGGYDKAIIDYFGKGLMEDVQKSILLKWYGEQPICTSITVPITNRTIVDNIGNRKYAVLIHTPTMRTPEVITDSKIVYHCMRSTLIEAMKQGVKSIVVPAFGGCTGQVDKRELANMMRLAYEQLINPPTEISWNTPLRFENYEIVQWSHAEGQPSLKSVLYLLEDTDSHTIA